MDYIWEWTFENEHLSMKLIWNINNLTLGIYSILKCTSIKVKIKYFLFELISMHDKLQPTWTISTLNSSYLLRKPFPTKKVSQYSTCNPIKVKVISMHEKCTMYRPENNIQAEFKLPTYSTPMCSNLYQKIKLFYVCWYF